MSALWHKHWHFKTTDKVIPVCQHYDTDIDISRQQMEFSLCVSIMTQTMTFQDNRWSYPCVSALWHIQWHSRQQMKLSLCVSIITQTLTLQDNRRSYPVYQHYNTDIDTFKTTDEVFPVCQHHNTDIDTSKQQNKLSLCVSIMTRTLPLQENR